MICRCKRQICADRNLKYICIPDGGLAQLARALPWHGRGHRFDSDILHESLKNFQAFTFSASFRIILTRSGSTVRTLNSLPSSDPIPVIC
jgi:hypothetical protein